MRKLNLVLLLTVFFYGWALADEGMWLPSLVYKLNISDMQKKGLKLSADDIYSINNSSLKDAVVALDRQFLAVAHAAVDLHRGVRAEHGGFGGE